MISFASPPELDSWWARRDSVRLTWRQKPQLGLYQGWLAPNHTTTVPQEVEGGQTVSPKCCPLFIFLYLLDCAFSLSLSLNPLNSMSCVAGFAGGRRAMGRGSVSGVHGFLFGCASFVVGAGCGVQRSVSWLKCHGAWGRPALTTCISWATPQPPRVLPKAETVTFLLDAKYLAPKVFAEWMCDSEDQSLWGFKEGCLLRLVRTSW